MKHISQKLKYIGVLLFFTFSSAEAATIGPVWPAPGGTAFSASGNILLAGGQTSTYSGFDFGAFDQLWWGPADIGSAMDGTIDSVGESMSLLSISGSTATWVGTTTVNTSSSGPQNVDTRFTATITSGAPGGWIDPSTVGISTTGLDAVAEITSGPFVVNLLFDARLTSIGGAYTPFKTFFDPITGPSELGNAVTSFSGQMYYTNPVPVPAAVWLFGSGLLGLVGVARRKSA